MNILLISGSPRGNGNCATLLGYVFDKLKQGQKTKVIKFSEKKVTPCGTKCNYPCLNPSRQGKSGERALCALKDFDDVQDIYKAMISADVIVAIVPNFGHSVPSVFHAFMERVEGMKHLLAPSKLDKKEIIIVLVSNEGSGYPLEELESFFMAIWHWQNCKIHPIVVGLGHIDPKLNSETFEKLASNVSARIQELEKNSKLKRN